MPSANPKLKLGALHLRMPGRDTRAGARMGRGVADQLAGLVPRGTARIGTIRVRAPAGSGEAQIARSVAAAIRKAMR